MPDESFEKTLEQRLTQLLEKNLKSIKIRLGKLSRRVEQLELMDFQNQLNSLDERIKQHQKSLLEAQRFLANFVIISTHNQSAKLGKQSQSETYKTLSSQFVSETTAAATKVSTSNDPLPIARAFKDKRYDDLDKKLNINTIRINF